MAKLRETSLRPGPLAAMAVAIAALVVAIGGTALASIPGPNGVVNSCYSNTTGAVRVIDSAASCGRGETQLGLLSPAVVDFARPYVAFGPGPRGGVQIFAEGGIQSVTRLSTGKYCVRPKANFVLITGTATAEFSNTSKGLAIAFVKAAHSGCPRFSLEVITGRLLNGRFHLTNDVTAMADPTG
jgi:hypothetical protein